MIFLPFKYNKVRERKRKGNKKQLYLFFKEVFNYTKMMNQLKFSQEIDYQTKLFPVILQFTILLECSSNYFNFIIYSIIKSYLFYSILFISVVFKINMEKGTCCPHGSWPRLQVNYESKGKKFQVANTVCYHVGDGNNILVLVSDIFGASSCYHQSFADTFASLGYNVYLPQLLTEPYNGEMEIGSIMACIKGQNFQTMKERFTGVVKHLEEKGHKRFFVIGFCWGVWFSFRMASQFDNIIAIGGMHPSLGVQQAFGGDVTDLTKSIKCPAYLFPAGNDPQNIKPNGQVVNILKQKFGDEKTGTHEFPDMIHGWTVRGDISDQKVKRDVKSAIHLCKDYFAKFQ